MLLEQRATAKTERALPNLAQLRIDKLLPKLPKSNAEIADPMRAKLLVDTELLIIIWSTIEKVEPNLVVPKTERLLPQRLKNLILRELPRVAKFKILVEEPNLVFPKILAEDPTLT
jgi:hypothetical protein